MQYTNTFLNYIILGNFTVINGILRTAHSLFKKYRYEFKSNELWTEIKYVLEKLAQPLTDLLVVIYTEFVLKHCKYTIYVS